MTAYNISCQFGGAPGQLVASDPANVPGSTAPAALQGNTQVTLQQTDVLTAINGTVTLKNQGELFLTLNMGPTGGPSDPLLGDYHRVNTGLEAGDYDISETFAAGTAPPAGIISLNFQATNMSPLPQPGWVEMEINFIVAGP